MNNLFYLFYFFFSFYSLLTLHIYLYFHLTSRWVDGPGLELLQYCVQTLSIDVVLVMSHDRLHSSLLASAGDGVTVVKLAHSGGVVQRV